MNSYDRPHKSLERKRGVFFRTGLLISLLVTFLAFEWKTAVPREEMDPDINLWDTVPEELPPITMRKMDIEIPASKPTNSTAPPIESNPVLVIIPDHSDTHPAPTDSFIVVDFIPIDPEPERDTIVDDFYLVPEVRPEFPGKDEGLTEYLRNHIRYPEIARKEGLNGTVYVNFIIDEKGNVTNIECLRSPNQMFTEEAFRVLRKMPTWKPGRQGGKPVRVKMSLPVSFRLL